MPRAIGIPGPDPDRLPVTRRTRSTSAAARRLRPATALASRGCGRAQRSRYLSGEPLNRLVKWGWRQGCKGMPDPYGASGEHPSLSFSGDLPGTCPVHARCTGWVVRYSSAVALAAEDFMQSRPVNPKGSGQASRRVKRRSPESDHGLRAGLSGQRGNQSAGFSVCCSPASTMSISSPCRCSSFMSFTASA